MTPVCLDCKQPADADVCTMVGHAVITVPHTVRREWQKALIENFNDKKKVPA